MKKSIPLWLIAVIILIAAGMIVLFYMLRDSPETQIRESIATIEDCLSRDTNPGIPFGNLDHVDHLKEQLMEEVEIEAPGYVKLHGKVERTLIARRYFMWRSNHPGTTADFSQINIKLTDDTHAKVDLIALVTNNNTRKQYRINLSYVLDGNWRVAKVVIE